jgi:hypothetical protein
MEAARHPTPDVLLRAPAACEVPRHCVTAAPHVCPGWARLFDALPLPPIAVGGVGAIALALVFLAIDLAEGNLATLSAGRLRFFEHVEVRSAIVVSLLLAGVVVTHHYEALGTRRDLEKLLPHLDRDEPLESGERSARRRRIAGLAGGLVISSIVPTLYVDPSRFLRFETYLLPSVLFDLVVGFVLGWTVSKTLYSALDEDRRFARLARRLRELDLFSLEPLHVFGRRGLRRTLRWMLLVSIASLVFFDAGKVLPPAVALTGIFGFALVCFLFPVWGVHLRLKQEKQRELAEVRSRIKSERDRLRSCQWRSLEAGVRFADLIAYEARIAAARTWPVDASMIGRLGVYGLLPIGSWLGSALIQHWVEIFLP